MEIYPKNKENDEPKSLSVGDSTPSVRSRSFNKFWILRFQTLRFQIHQMGQRCCFILVLKYWFLISYEDLYGEIP